MKDASGFHSQCRVVIMLLFTADLLLCDVLITEFGADVIGRREMMQRFPRAWIKLLLKSFNVCWAHVAWYCFFNEPTTKHLNMSFMDAVAQASLWAFLSLSILFLFISSSSHHQDIFCVVCRVHITQVLTKLWGLALKFTRRSPWRYKPLGFLLRCDNKQTYTYGHLLHTSGTHVSVLLHYKHIRPCCLPQANMSKCFKILFTLRASNKALTKQNNTLWWTYSP